MKSSKSIRFEHNIPQIPYFQILHHNLCEHRWWSGLASFYSFLQKILKVCESLMLISKKNHPSKTWVIINYNENISFSTHTCSIGVANRSMWIVWRGLVVKTMYLTLNDVRVYLLNWQALQIWSFSNLSFGKPFTNSSLDSFSMMCNKHAQPVRTTTKYY